jgi:tetratricopeptide (TPR) repeat protein
MEPSLLVAYTERGSAYCELRRYPEAISDFTTAIELNPLDSVNYVCRAVAYDEIGKYRETILDFSRAIELNPEDPIGYFSRALAYHKVDDFENALRDYDKVIELDVDFLDARQNRKIAEDQLKALRRSEAKSTSAAMAATADGASAPINKRAKVYDIFTKAEITQD